MDNTKPDPLFPAPTLGTICPVCGKKSYSAAGVHPQCAVQQADAPRQAKLAARKRELKDATAAEKLLGNAKDNSKFNGPSRPKNPR